MKFLSLLFFSALSTASAHIPIEFLGNIDGLLNPEFAEASLSQAVSFWESGLARKIRLLGDYGPKKEGQYCHFQISERDKDCPQDAVMEFTQRLFPAPTGDVAVNTAVSDPVSRLTPKILGMMVEWYARNRENLSSEHSAKLLEDLWEMVLPKLIKQEEEFLEHKIHRFEEEARALEQNKKYNISNLSEQRNKILETMDEEDALLFKEPVTENIEEILKKISPGRDSYSKAQGILEIDKKIKLQKDREKLASIILKLRKIQINKPSTEDIEKTFSTKKPDESDVLPLAYLFVKAFVEALIYEKENPGVYPEHATIHNLMAFVYQKAGFWPTKLSPEEAWKEHVAEFLEAAPSLLKDPHQKIMLEIFKNNEKVDPDTKDPLLREAYWTQKTYEVSKGSSEFPAPYGTAQAVCLPLDQIKEPIEKILDKIKATPRTFSDCGESTLRSFFNIVLYNKDKERVDLKVWDDIKKTYKLSPPQGIEAFFTFSRGKFLDPKAQNIALANHLWNIMVTSHLEGVAYNGEGCNIRSLGGGVNGLKNMLIAIEAILGVPDLALTKPTSGMNASPQETPNDKDPIAQKLNGLCQLFSRDGFEISWKVQRKEEKVHEFPDHGSFGIEFNINQKPGFSWDFQNGHFTFSSLRPDWHYKFLSKNNPKNLSSTLWGWLLSPATITTIEKAEKEFLSSPAASYALADTNSTSIIDSVDLASQYQGDKQSYERALRWVKKFSVFDDLETARELAEQIPPSWSMSLIVNGDPKGEFLHKIYPYIFDKLFRHKFRKGTKYNNSLISFYLKKTYNSILKNYQRQDPRFASFIFMSSVLTENTQNLDSLRKSSSPPNFADSNFSCNFIASFAPVQLDYYTHREKSRFLHVQNLTQPLTEDEIIDILKAAPFFHPDEVDHDGDNNVSEKAEDFCAAISLQIKNLDQEKVYDLFLTLIENNPKWNQSLHKKWVLDTEPISKRFFEHFLRGSKKEAFYQWANQKKLWEKDVFWNFVDFIKDDEENLEDEKQNLEDPESKKEVDPFLSEISDLEEKYKPKENKS